ncbi:alpha/beta fold hydrolase (plasmid) [Streptomyces sp. BI20]|uniref:alpha/beta fold hydrolase n=1 Tax=Streptomyces sp. BI20 TaxID=3403460 RepID=UPI003C750756
MGFTGTKGWTRAGALLGALAIATTLLPVASAAATGRPTSGPAHVRTVPDPTPAGTAPKSVPAADPGTWCPTVPGHRVDCGLQTRPLVVDRPGLGTIDVAFAVVRHSGPGPAKGTVAVNPGGPGESLVDGAPYVTPLLSGLLREHDLLLVDPRGTGRSERLECGLTDADLRFADRAAQRAAVARCGRALGPRVAAYTSAATADDIDAIRARLGVPRLTLYGLSYGTYLMPVYASRHPERVRNMVLSGAYPLDFDPLSRPGAQAVSLAVRRICDRAAPTAGGRPACDGRQAVRDLATTAARLRDRPLRTTVPLAGTDRTRTLLLTEGKLANLAFESASSGVGADPTAPSLLGNLPQALNRFAHGDTKPLLDLVRAEYTGADDADQAPYTAVVCNDYRTAWSPEAGPAERRRQYRAALAGTAPGEFGAFSPRGYLEGPTDGGDLCLDWPREHAPDRQPIRPALPRVPVLVLSGDLDANTPEANGRRAAAKFPGAVFVPVRNTGHVPELSADGCAVELSTRFVTTGTVGDTSCARRTPPIAVTPVRR